MVFAIRGLSASKSSTLSRFGPIRTVRTATWLSLRPLWRIEPTQNVSCYLRTAFPSFQKDKCVMLLNYIGKHHELTLTTNSRVMRVKPFDVPADVLTSASNLVQNLQGPTESPTKKAEELDDMKDGAHFTGMFKVTELLPSNTIGKVKDLEMKYTTEGELVAISNVHMYDACKNIRCYNKKLNSSGTCGTCNTTYTEDPQRAIVCNIGVMSGDNLKQLTLFRPQVENLLQSPIGESSSEDVENQILDLMPARVRFTESPKDSTCSTLARN